ncbi:hypothetical protein [Flavobacterium akiainvivens]|nr:hypothetical protein [Flavobacterium akiainvivens]
MKFKKYLYLIIFLPFFCSAQSLNWKIAKEDQKKVLFVEDTVLIKEFFKELIPKEISVAEDSIPNTFDKISIESALLQDDNGKILKDYYYVMCRNFKLKLKIAILLKKEGKDFIMFYDSPTLSHHELDMNKCFLTCYGTNEDCYPQLYIDKGAEYWTSSAYSYCNPDSPCKQTIGLLQL